MQFHEKLNAALSARIGEGVTVWTDPSGRVVLDENGTNARALASVYGHEVDKRKAPTAEIVDSVIGRAARALRSDIPKYRPEFVAPAQAFAARLQGVIA